MGCPGSMIPGFQQSEDIAKQNRGLSTKMDALISSEEGKPKKTKLISESDAIRRSSVKMSPREGGFVLKDTEMTTPLDNFIRGDIDTRQVHNMLSENFILHRINKDGSITAFLEIDNGKYKVIKGLRTFEDVSREIGIPNPYEER